LANGAKANDQRRLAGIELEVAESCSSFQAPAQILLQVGNTMGAAHLVKILSE
jgi:hypothetical protein